MHATDWIALDRLLIRPDRARVVGHGPDGRAVDHVGFHARVCAWRLTFAAHAAQDLALYLDDSLEFAAALFGAWHAGKRPVLCADTLPGTLEALTPHVQGYAGDMPTVSDAIVPAAVPAVPAVALDALDERACDLVVFTSGSTGQPSAIVKRLDQLAREVEALEQAFGARVAGTQVHGTVSHQHIYGLLFRVLWPLASGRLIQPRRFFHEDLIAALASGDSIMVATPAHLKRLPEQLDWQSARSHVRAVFSSGGPLSVEAAALCGRLLGMAPIEVFGSSETGGIAWRQSLDGQGTWQPLPGVEWRESDGCLSVRSAHLPQLEWWQSQDRVRALPDGSFQLLGRADRIVKIEERRVSLDALERDLCREPGVAEARVIVLPGAREQLAAVIVPSDAALVTAPQVERRRFTRELSSALSRNHDMVTRPRKWRLCAALPINAQGKVTQAALLELFQQGLPVPQWGCVNATRAQVKLELDPGLKVFEGHFPQAAILPGVAQVDWAIHFARQRFVLPPCFKRMEQLKFQQVARPGDVLDLELVVDADKGTLSFRFTSAIGVHSSGRVVFSNDK